ncbi:MAG TPA: formyltransferase family protein [Gaiellaceae bacterium]|nr:formyltransferase family protein [Gaiellaceae bacterium]
MTSSWRIVVVTRILPVALGFLETVRAAGHEPVALLSIRDTENRYGSEFTLDALLNGVPAELDVLLPAQRSSIAPLLASVSPDLVVCMGFPWKVPADALAIPTHGWLNGHPSQLPRHRGPIPVAWAIRSGDAEVGLTFHRMDADLDTGPILAQATMEIGEYAPPDDFYPRMGPLMMGLLGDALAKLAAGEEGRVQEGGEYESFFTDDDAWLDFSRPAAELHRLVWSWRYAITRGELRGALAEVDGDTVRVLASSLHEVDGAQHIDCGDGALWLAQTEPVEELSSAEARRASAPARSTR